MDDGVVVAVVSFGTYDGRLFGVSLVEKKDEAGVSMKAK